MTAYDPLVLVFPTGSEDMLDELDDALFEIDALYNLGYLIRTDDASEMCQLELRGSPRSASRALRTVAALLEDYR